MKKYLLEIIILILQFIMFYIYPLILIIIKNNNPIGMILIILLSAIILSFILGILSKSKIKYIYPIITALLFIPTVYIYYNESAIIHSLWYLIVSIIGIIPGIIIRKKYIEKN